MGEVGWQGSVTPGAPEIEVWGASFKDIEAKIRKEYDPDFSIYTEEEQEVPGASEDPGLVARQHLERRMVR
ncbi:secreted protein [Colletotrichum tofieldiae]|nr:secreted protein [Colletotrichum tofieldiae]GKT70524.1 secreted protein [Colletotrichum tofieldiae]GKT93592.1 secreted protein [Colletotrichum tofieldiae]